MLCVVKDSRLFPLRPRYLSLYLDGKKNHSGANVDFFAPEWFFFPLRYKDRYLGLRAKSLVNLYNTEHADGNTLALTKLETPKI